MEDLRDEKRNNKGEEEREKEMREVRKQRLRSNGWVQKDKREKEEMTE